MGRIIGIGGLLSVLVLALGCATSSSPEVETLDWRSEGVFYRTDAGDQPLLCAVGSAARVDGKQAVAQATTAAVGRLQAVLDAQVARNILVHVDAYANPNQTSMPPPAPSLAVLDDSGGLSQVGSYDDHGKTYLALCLSLEALRSQAEPGHPDSELVEAVIASAKNDADYY